MNKDGFFELVALTPGAPPGGSDMSPGSSPSGLLFQFDTRICPFPFTATFFNPANPEDPLIFSGTSEPAGYLKKGGEPHQQVDFLEWGEAFFSRLFGAATLDRLRHGTYREVLDGNSYRAPRPFPEKIKNALAKGGKKPYTANLSETQNGPLAVTP